MLFILSPKSGPRSDFLPNVVLFGLFLLSAIAYLKIAFYLCISNTLKGVARSFKDFPPAGHASATHEELKTAFRQTAILTLSKPLPPYTFPARTRCTRKAEQNNGGHWAAPVTLRQKRPVGLGAWITWALPACDCTKGPRNWNTDNREGYPHRHYISHGGKKGREQPASGERKRLWISPD